MSKPRIAVIDDDAVFVELMVDLLANGEGYEVVSNAQAADSFEFIKQEQPDLVILDLMMGREETGWAVLDLLAAEPTTAEIPVILCTAAAPALRDNAKRLVNSRVIASINKPFDVDDLLDLIDRLLAQRSGNPVP
ncbi:MAG TPA: response regulator [Chloroflexota bacterium]|nr:response regulator [Chloroflexota bacterium]